MRPQKKKCGCSALYLCSHDKPKRPAKFKVGDHVTMTRDCEAIQGGCDCTIRKDSLSRLYAEWKSLRTCYEPKHWVKEEPAKKERKNVWKYSKKKWWHLEEEETNITPFEIRKPCHECGYYPKAGDPPCDHKPAKKEKPFTYSGENVREAYDQGYADALKDPRSMYNAGFDAGKEAIGKGNEEVAKAVKYALAIIYDFDCQWKEEHGWEIEKEEDFYKTPFLQTLKDFIKRTLPQSK